MADRISAKAVKELEDLYRNGHTIDELIELLSDKQEQHDIYVNSGLMQKDFKHIITALKFYQLHNNNTDAIQTNEAPQS